MKSLAIIISVYILALTAIPCADVHAADTHSVSVELLEQSNNHSSDVDLCSPFCFCNCCQTLSQTTTFNTTQVIFAGFDIATPVLVQNEMECTITFWRPPKS
jgi:hypothetical protein